ncbi:MAG TPA: HAD family hydrolase [Pyrinomonadaceae bacterium]|jgi:HAD superfamily hydrolase (TIGR01509 family)
MTNTDATEQQAALHPALSGVRAVLFDMGGTLVQPDWPRLAHAAAAEAGRTFTAQELERAMKEMLCAVDHDLQRGLAPAPDTRLRHWVFRRMYGALGLDAEACGRLSALLDTAHDERHLWSLLDPDAPHVLAALRAHGLRLAVVSNTEDGRLADLLELVELTAHLDLHLDSFVVGVRKPDAAIFQLALKQLDLAPDEAAFVGDSYGHDAQPAMTAGLRALLLDPLDLYPDSTCPRIRRLADLLDPAAVA